MKKIRVAQIGIGHDHSARVFQSMRDQQELFDIVGYAFTPKEEAHVPQKNDIHEGYRYLQYFDGIPKLTIEEIMQDRSIEAVVIETEESELFQYCLMAVEHRKHVHMDKPGGFSLEEYETILRMAKENGTVFHTGYMYRYNPYVQELMTSVKSGELGEIISVYADMSCKHVTEKRKWLETLPGGMMFFLGCHMLDLVMQLQGVPEKVIPMNCVTGTDGVNAKDFGMAILQYPKGISIVKSSASEYGGFVCRKLVVSGTKKTVILDPLETHTGEGIHATRTVYDKQDWEDPGICSKSMAYSRFDGMIAAFAQMVAGETDNPYTYEYELLLYRTLLRCCDESV